MKIQYRFANVNDLDQLVVLRTLMQSEVNNLNENQASEEFKEKIKNYFLKSLDEKKYFSAVAVDGANIVGTAGVCFYEKPPSISGGNGLVGYVTNVYTKKEYRGQGIGTSLMKKLNDLGRDLGADRLHLGATADGVSVYKAAGYKVPNFVNLEIRSPFESAR